MDLSIAGLDYISLGWVAISFIVLYRFNINMIAWIGVSAVFGLARFLTIP